MQERRVAVMFSLVVPWLARCLDGARRYAREQGGLRLVLCCPPTLGEPAGLAAVLRRLEDWRRDAMLVASNTESSLRSALDLGVPVVNLVGGVADSCGVSRVMVNHEQAGRMAATHLLGRGLQHLAHAGWSDKAYSLGRDAGFRRCAAEAGASCRSFLLSADDDLKLGWSRRMGDVTGWLSELPLPCGIFATNDHRAQFLIEACDEMGLRIPEDIALMGMDDDETVCEHAVPTLTSISGNSEQVGYEAMALLDGMMQGETRPTGDVLVEPDRVVERQSTNRLYFSDPLVQRAVDYVREHMASQLNIAALAEHLGVSKRTLELRFRKSLETSPYEYITRLRVQHAQALLRQPQKRTVEQLARECGFGTAVSVYAAFKRFAGQSPSAYRKTHAKQGSSRAPEGT